MNTHKLAGVLLMFYAFWGINKVCAQEGETFHLLPDSEMVQLHYGFWGESMQIRIENLPENMEEGRIYIKNTNRNYTLQGGLLQGNVFSFSLSDSYLPSDTLLISIEALWTGVIYPAEMITGRSSGVLKFGNNCYKLKCVPKSDPWMPSAERPFLFRADGYYINPKNGKIKKGRRLINSGIYESCDLKWWCYINPVLNYTDKNGKKYRGQELINKGRLNWAEWEQNAFNNPTQVGY